jgi:TonB family protein
MRKLCLVSAVLAALALAGVAIASEATVEEPFVIADTRITPEYPPAAKAAGFPGTVVVAAVVNADGSVGVVEVVESSGGKLGFDEAAMDAMSKWRFSPARVDGQAVDSVYAYVFHFQSPRSTPFVVGDYITSELMLGNPLDLKRTSDLGTGISPGGSGGGGLSPAAFLGEKVRTLNKNAMKTGERVWDRRELFQPPSGGVNHTIGSSK